LACGAARQRRGEGEAGCSPAAAGFPKRKPTAAAACLYFPSRPRSKVPSHCIVCVLRTGSQRKAFSVMIDMHHAHQQGNCSLGFLGIAPPATTLRAPPKKSNTSPALGAYGHTEPVLSEPPPSHPAKRTYHAPRCPLLMLSGASLGIRKRPWETPLYLHLITNSIAIRACRTFAGYFCGVSPARFHPL
jgi:hypothetical protein